MIPTEAIPDDGVSRHYLSGGAKARASKGMVNALEEACRENRVDYQKGAVWTTSAPFRELRSKVGRLQVEGVLAVEMEAAAVFAVAAFRKVEAGAFLCISDELAGPRWKPRFYSKKLQAAERKLVDVAVDAIQRF